MENTDSSSEFEENRKTIPTDHENEGSDWIEDRTDRRADRRKRRLIFFLKWIRWKIAGLFSRSKLLADDWSDKKLTGMDNINAMERMLDELDKKHAEETGGDWEIKLIFLPEVASDVEKIRWHETQRSEWLEDGTLKLQFTISKLNEIFWWVIGYGARVQVVSPPELQEAILFFVRGMIHHQVKKCPDNDIAT